MVHLGFNAEGVAPMEDFSPIPAGEYEVMATDSVLKATKAGTGQYLEIIFQVLDGDFKGRKLWSRLNIINPSEQAMDIAQRELSTICRAAGKLRVEDSSELHNIPMIAKVAIEPGRDGYGPSNRIKNYKPVEGAVAAAPATLAPAAAAPAAAPAPQTAAVGTGAIKPPWQK